MSARATEPGVPVPRTTRSRRPPSTPAAPSGLAPAGRCRRACRRRCCGWTGARSPRRHASTDRRECRTRGVGGSTGGDPDARRGCSQRGRRWRRRDSGEHPRGAVWPRRGQRCARGRRRGGRSLQLRRRSRSSRSWPRSPALPCSRTTTRAGRWSRRPKSGTSSVRWPIPIPAATRRSPADHDAPRVTASTVRPAWARESAAVAITGVTSLEHLDEEWAFGGADGSGVRVAIVDSGIDADHPVLEGAVDADRRDRVLDQRVGRGCRLRRPAPGCVRARHGVCRHHPFHRPRVRASPV